MLNEIKYHADNLNQILEIEGEEGQFEYLIDYGKKVVALQKLTKTKKPHVWMLSKSMVKNL